MTSPSAKLMGSNKPRKNKKNKKKDDDITLHKYVNKIVAYTEEGIFILEKNLISVKKKE